MDSERTKAKQDDDPNNGITVDFINKKNISTYDIDQLRTELGAPNNTTLFPPHFLKSTFFKIGGEMFVINIDQTPKAALFLFPRQGGDKQFTARFSIAPSAKEVLDTGDIWSTLYEAGIGFELYSPDDKHQFISTHNISNGIDIGNPSEEEANKIRKLQKDIWNTQDDYLYPVDIHSSDFNLATRLVARHNGEVTGFLFGFYKFGEPLPAFLDKYKADIRIESQLMGLIPTERSKGVGYHLKRQQALQAKAEGIDVINWTFDPLQLPNAILNFNKLGGICFEHYPNYYQFRNELNQVAASRFNITWLVNSDRVKGKLDTETRTRPLRGIEDMNDITVVNKEVENYTLEATTRNIAIQIPSNWTQMQQQDIDLAIKWRQTTDSIFSHYISPTKYTLSEVATDANGSFYLIGQKLDQIVNL